MTAPESSAGVSVAAVILAAGASSRMGRPKLLLPWGDTSVLGHLIHQWTELGAGQIAVVVAAGDQTIQRELDRLGFAPEHRIPNPQPERGMFSSIQCAARWTGWHASPTHWAIILGDQPHLKLETLRALIRFAAAHAGKVCQPAQGGRARHPVLLPTAAFEGLKASRAENLKQFLQEAPCERALCAVDDPGLGLDIDRPEDYAEACRQFGDGR